MVHYSMTVIWLTLVGALYTTNVAETGWMSVRQTLCLNSKDAVL